MTVEVPLFAPEYLVPGKDLITHFQHTLLTCDYVIDF